MKRAYNHDRWRDATPMTRKQHRRLRKHRDCLRELPRRRALRQFHQHHRTEFDAFRDRKIRRIERRWRRITVKHVASDAEQRGVIAAVLEAGHDFGANRRVRVSAIATITQECVARNCVGGDRDSVGAFQQRSSTGWVGDLRNVRTASRNYYRRAPTFSGGAIGYEASHPSAGISEIAQAIQRSAFPSAYGIWADEARRTVRRFDRLRQIR